MSTVIKAENISKKYLIGHNKRQSSDLREALSNKVKKLAQKIKNPFLSTAEPAYEEFWALKDVSFAVKQGDRIGIIGRNGAGKSTLLKILSRITEPTSGRITLKGRVASLLEVGTGFHPDLTGRENIFLNGAILGMSRAEISRKFDEIVDFAEVERFLDTPVKHYSSGMYVRLAFAVAAHLEPEILIVDEVLAVGDVQFQKKCLGKMEDVGREGRTVLFVSHNMGAITKLCRRTFWLNNGEIVLEDSSRKVVNRYQSEYLTLRTEWKRPFSENIDSVFAFLNVAVRNSEGQLSSFFGDDQPVTVEVIYKVRHMLSGCQVGARIYNSDGLVVFTTSDSDNSGLAALPKEPGCYRAMFTIPGNFLSPGTYSLLVAAHLPNRIMYEVIEETVAFDISSSTSLALLDGRLGIVAPLFQWETYKN